RHPGTSARLKSGHRTRGAVASRRRRVGRGARGAGRHDRSASGLAKVQGTKSGKAIGRPRLDPRTRAGIRAAYAPGDVGVRAVAKKFGVAVETLIQHIDVDRDGTGFSKSQQLGILGDHLRRHEPPDGSMPSTLTRAYGSGG